MLLLFTLLYFNFSSNESYSHKKKEKRKKVEDIYKDFLLGDAKKNYLIFLVVALLAGYRYKSFLNYLIIE